MAASCPWDAAAIVAALPRTPPGHAIVVEPGRGLFLGRTAPEDLPVGLCRAVRLPLGAARGVWGCSDRVFDPRTGDRRALAAAAEHGTLGS